MNRCISISNGVAAIASPPHLRFVQSEMFDPRLDKLYDRQVQQKISTSTNLMSAPHSRGQPRHMNGHFMPANQMLSHVTLEQQHISNLKFQL